MLIAVDCFPHQETLTRRLPQHGACWTLIISNCMLIAIDCFPHQVRERADQLAAEADSSERAGSGALGLPSAQVRGSGWPLDGL